VKRSPCGSRRCRLLAKLSRDLQTCLLDQRGQPAKTRHWHTQSGSGDAQTRLHASCVTVNWSSDTANVQLVFLQVTRVSVLADAEQLRFEFLKISDRIRSQTFQVEFGQNAVLLIFRHISQHD